MEDYEIEKMLNKADSLSENGNYRQAIRIYADAIAYCPSYNKFRLGAAYLGMAVCYAKIGDKDKANEYAAKGYDNYGDFFPMKLRKCQHRPIKVMNCVKERKKTTIELKNIEGKVVS